MSGTGTTSVISTLVPCSIGVVALVGTALARLEVVSTAVGPGVVPSAPAVLETIASMLAADVRAPALVLSLADEDGDELALVAVLALVPSL
eukprot:2501825-Rhodomonas_salina.2